MSAASHYPGPPRKNSRCRSDNIRQFPCRKGNRFEKYLAQIRAGNRARTVEVQWALQAKWIGYIIRRKLGLKTQKSHGIFTIALSEKAKLDRLYEKYGLASENSTDPESQSDQSQVQQLSPG